MESPSPRRTPRAIAFRLLRLSLAAYLSVVLLMTFLERWLVYPAPPVDRANWNPPGEFEEVGFTSADGTRLHGWFYPRENSSRTILYCHGNGEMVADNHELMSFLRERLDAQVFLFDYRGYGKSEGKPFERGIVADGLAATQWLIERTGSAADRVVLIGRSIGGGVATAIAADRGAGALVLQSTFTRLPDAAAQHYPWLPVRLVMSNRFDSVARLQKYRGPLLVSHGTADAVVPYDLGRELFESAASSDKQWLELANRNHNQPQPAKYYADLLEFLENRRL